MRNSTDFSPLYRSFIGVDHLANLIDKASQPGKQSSYPPYNIELLAENQYRITMAVAGFSEDDIDIESKDNGLIIVGTKQVATNSDQEHISAPRHFLHQGIAERNFERKFRIISYPIV